MKLRLGAEGRVMLSELLDRVNLPDVIAREFGLQITHGLNRERGGVICDPRPGHLETHPSFSVYRGRGGRWHWKRHGGSDHDRGDALSFLESIGYSRAQALEELARHVGVTLDAWTPNLNPPPYQTPDPLAEARAVLGRCAPLAAGEVRQLGGLFDTLVPTDAAARDLRHRGLFGWAGLETGRMRRNFTTREGKVLARAGALVLVIRGPDGQPWGVKVRNLGSKEALDAAGLQRYVYRIAGHGAPAWCSPNYGQGEAVLIVEGELNGAAAARAFNGAGLSVDVQGLAGAGGTPYLHGLNGKAVYLYADPDDAGAACLNRMGTLAQAAGAREVRVLAALPEGDFCDHLGRLGSTAFAGVLAHSLGTSAPYHTVLPASGYGPSSTVLPPHQTPRASLVVRDTPEDLSLKKLRQRMRRLGVLL